jgi:hypothetical protein
VIDDDDLSLLYCILFGGILTLVILDWHCIDADRITFSFCSSMMDWTRLSFLLAL